MSKEIRTRLRVRRVEGTMRVAETLIQSTALGLAVFDSTVEPVVLHRIHSGFFM